jgi:hypothetical protein
MDERKRRIAENEVRFREINERLNADLERLEMASGLIAFVCECGHGDCTEPVELTCDEYSHGRQDAMVFLVVPGHEIPDSETVLVKTDRYAAVRKNAEAGPFIDAHTPDPGP